MRIALAFVLVTSAVTAFALPKPTSNDQSGLETKEQKTKTSGFTEENSINKLNTLQGPSKQTSGSPLNGFGAFSGIDSSKKNQPNNPTSFLGPTSTKRPSSVPAQDGFPPVPAQTKDPKRTNDLTQTQSKDKKGSTDSAESTVSLTHALSSDSVKLQTAQLQGSIGIPPTGSKKLNANLSQKLDLNSIRPETLRVKKVDPALGVQKGLFGSGVRRSSLATASFQTTSNYISRFHIQAFSNTNNDFQYQSFAAVQQDYVSFTQGFSTFTRTFASSSWPFTTAAQSCTEFFTNLNYLAVSFLTYDYRMSIQADYATQFLSTFLDLLRQIEYLLQTIQTRYNAFDPFTDGLQLAWQALQRLFAIALQLGLDVTWALRQINLPLFYQVGLPIDQLLQVPTTELFAASYQYSSTTINSRSQSTLAN